MEINSDSDVLLEAIEHLVDEGFLEHDTGAYWSAVQYAKGGLNSLSLAQKYWVDRLIHPLLKKYACPVCGDLVPPDLKLCAHHQNHWDKD